MIGGDVAEKWELGVRYDRRFGWLGFRARNPETGEQADMVASVGDIIRHCGIQPDELRAYCQDAVNPGVILGVRDITETRLRVLEETDWKGKVVLDIGGYDGAAAKVALDKGAARAVCLDNLQYRHYAANDPGTWPDVRKEGVEYVTGDFMNFRAERPRWLFGVDGSEDEGSSVPCPDIIIFFNVLYHLKNPWAGLERLRSLLNSDGEMLLCTLFRYSDRPVWYYYDARECNPKDESVFWGPSISGLERVLRDTGWTFKQEGLAIDRVVYRCWPTGQVAGRQSRV